MRHLNVEAVELYRKCLSNEFHKSIGGATVKCFESEADCYVRNMQFVSCDLIVNVMATALIESVLHWRRKLDKDPEDEYIINVIRKLSKVPMTLEILEATHIGKTIRKLSKRDGTVGEKAKTILNKWRETFANQESEKNKLPNDSRKENVNKDNQTSSKHKSPEKTHLQKQSSHYEHKQKTDSRSKSLSEQSLKYVNGVSKINNSTESSLSHYEYNVKERNSNYQVYDPQTDSSEGYNPECPELYSTNKPVKTKKTVLVETYVPSSVKRKLTHEKEQNEAKSQHKKLKSSNHLDTALDSKKSPEKDKHILNKEKTKDETHSSFYKKGSDKVSCSSKNQDSVPKKTKCKESSETDRTKLKKTKLKILSSEEFTASEVSFEDCLGLNDIVSLKKSAKSHSSTKKQPSSSTPSKQKSTEKSKKSSSKTSSSNEKVKVSKDSSSHSDKRKDSDIRKTKDSTHSDKNIPFTVPKPDKDLSSVDIAATLPKISTNYIPRSPEFYEPKRKVLSNEEAIQFMSSKKDRTAVYSGRKARYGPTEVPRLFNLCMRFLMDNIDVVMKNTKASPVESIEGLSYVGGVPYEIMFPVLEKCTPEQLLYIEHYNPKFVTEEKSNTLWEKHCNRKFKLLKPGDHETWRELYLRARDEEEVKLRKVAANISRSMLKSTPVRQTKLAYVDSHSYVKPPRDIAKKQARNGTAVPVNVIKPNSQLKRPLASAASSASSSGSSVSSSAPKKPKQPAPLMAKTLKLIKGYRRK